MSPKKATSPYTKINTDPAHISIEPVNPNFADIPMVLGSIEYLLAHKKFSRIPPPYYPKVFDYIFREYREGRYDRKQFYDTINSVLKYLSCRGYSKPEKIFKKLLDDNGICYLVELSDIVNLRGDFRPLRVDFCIMDNENDYEIVAFYEIDGDGHTNERGYDERKNEYFKNNGVTLNRLTEDHLKDEKAVLSGIHDYINHPGAHSAILYMDEHFIVGNDNADLSASIKYIGEFPDMTWI